VNILQLVPTVALISCAPDHFFKRLPQTLRSGRSIHLTPVKFFLRSAALFIAYFSWRHSDLAAGVGEATARATLILLIPIVPFIMALLAIAVYIGHNALRLAPGGYETPDFEDVRIVLSLGTYKRLNWGRYLWGILYLTVYSIMGWQIVQVVGAYAVLGAAWLVSQVGQGQEPLKGILILMAIGATVLVVHELVFRPYAEMLKAATRPPP